MNNKKIEFTFKFVKQYDKSEKLEEKENRIYINVGQNIKNGFVHYTQFNSTSNVPYKSSASILSKYYNIILKDILSKNPETIEIILPTNLNFDCFVSYYLLRQIIFTGELPDNYQYIIDYAEKVNRCVLSIDISNYNTPYAIARALGNVISNKLHYSQKSMYPEKLLNRGLELIEYIMDNIKMFPKDITDSIFYQAIFTPDCPFKEELKLIKNDYDNYIKDFEKSKKLRIKLPEVSESYDILREVDALILEDIPSSLLFSFWARSDKNSPSGKGFNLVLNRQSIPTKTEKDDRKIRTFISVDSNSSINLKSLAEALNVEENAKSNSKPKEPVWYDGEHLNYKVIDTFVGSILTLDEIIYIIRTYTKARVKKANVKVVFPFNFNKKEFNSICLNKKSDKIEVKPNVNLKCYHPLQKTKDYFLSYVNKYLFQCDECNGGQSYCKLFSLNKNNYNLISLDSVFFQKLERDFKLTDVSINNSDIYFFKYGAGFLVLDININTDEHPISDCILELNNFIVKKYSYIFSYYNFEINEVFKLNLQGSKPITYTTIEIDSDSLYINEKDSLVYKLCNVSPSDKSIGDIYIDELAKKYFMRIDNYAIYGFNKNGSSLLLVDENYPKHTNIESIDALYDLSVNAGFFIFILALHQRYILMDFTDRLSKHGIGESQNLHLQLLDFTTQSWFSQITDGEIGMELYKRWQETFEVIPLYEEISRQIASVDDYQNAVVSNSFSKFSAIFFPVVLVLSFLSSGIIKVEAEIKINNYIFSLMVPILIVICGVIQHYIIEFCKKPRKNKK